MQIVNKCRFCGKPIPNHKKYCSHNCYAKGKTALALEKNTFTCPSCGVVFQDAKKKKRRFCSNECKHKSFIGKIKTSKTLLKIREKCLEIGHWHSTPTYIDSRGFVVVTGTSKKLHTVIAERVLGRPLKKNETVHHIDGNRLNNNNDNLLVCERSLHPTIHAKMRQPI